MSPTFETSPAARRAYNRMPRHQVRGGMAHVEWLAIGGHEIVE